MPEGVRGEHVGVVLQTDILERVFATIYDMIVIPKLNDSNIELFNMERNLVKNELRRVGYFASLAMNFYDSKDALNNVCFKYDLDLDTIINEL
jgi:hypothetical protein